MKPHVLEQGFDKDKNLWGLGRERGPFLQKGPLPLPEFHWALEKRIRGGGC